MLGSSSESNNKGTTISSNVKPINVIAPAPAIARINNGVINPIRANVPAIIAITPMNIKIVTKFIF